MTRDSTKRLVVVIDSSGIDAFQGPGDGRPGSMLRAAQCQRTKTKRSEKSQNARAHPLMRARSVPSRHTLVEGASVLFGSNPSGRLQRTGLHPREGEEVVKLLRWLALCLVFACLVRECRGVHRGWVYECTLLDPSGV